MKTNYTNFMKKLRDPLTLEAEKSPMESKGEIVFSNHIVLLVISTAVAFFLANVLITY